MRNLFLEGNRDEVFEISVPAGEREEIRIAARTKNSERLKVRVRIRHEGGDSFSLVRLFGTAGDNSRIDFIAELEIPSGLQNVEASQHAHVLLLSPAAVGSAIPKQDVATPGARAFHGASCAGIPAGEDYYLSCLGLAGPDKSKLLSASHLARAFAGLPENMLEPALALVYDGSKGGLP